MTPTDASVEPQFLASARADLDPLYPAYVLLLVLGLSRGELLALHWANIDLDVATVHVHREIQRNRPEAPTTMTAS